MKNMFMDKFTKPSQCPQASSRGFSCFMRRKMTNVHLVSNANGERWYNDNIKMMYHGNFISLIPIKKLTYVVVDDWTFFLDHQGADKAMDTKIAVFISFFVFVCHHMLISYTPCKIQ